MTFVWRQLLIVAFVAVIFGGAAGFSVGKLEQGSTQERRTEYRKSPDGLSYLTWAKGEERRAWAVGRRSVYKV